MMSVDQQRLIGNSGAGKVVARLSGHCLVRPVSDGTDVGVDLYCETVERGMPFLHFWLQVKAGSQCYVSKNGTFASCSFKASHLSYWARQPVPVFAALIPTPGASDPTIFIVCITDHLLREGAACGRTCRLRSDFTLEPGSTDDILYLVTNRVPRSTALMACRTGVIAALPYPEPRRSGWVPLAPVAMYEQEILEQIRSTAAWSIVFLDVAKQLEGQSHSTTRGILSGVLAQFGNDRHWEGTGRERLLRRLPCHR